MSLTKAYLFALSATALCFQPAVAREVFIEQSATVSDLRYSLVDLNPNDQVAPSVTFGTGHGTLTATKQEPRAQAEGYYGFDKSEQKAFDATFTDAASDTLAAYGNHVTAQSTATGALASVQVTSDTAGELVGRIQQQPYWGYELIYGADARNAGATPDYFLLGAHTSLVIEGSVAVDLLLSDNALALQSLAAENNIEFRIWTNQTAGASIRLQQPDGTWADSANGGAMAQVVGTYTINAGGIEQTPYRPGETLEPVQKTFRLEVSNTSDHALQGFVSYSAQSSVIMYAGSPTAAVPEPATWASFALGLGLLGAAVARQRKRRA